MPTYLSLFIPPLLYSRITQAFLFYVILAITFSGFLRATLAQSFLIAWSPHQGIKLRLVPTAMNSCIFGLAFHLSDEVLSKSKHSTTS